MEKRDKNVDVKGRSRGSVKDSINTSQMSSAPSLAKNIIREQRNRDPFKYYEVVEVMGVGSMGTVSRVKKKESAVGGSARISNSQRGLNERNPCHRIPFIGCIFDSCTGHSDRWDIKNTSSRLTCDSVGDSDRSDSSCLGGSSNPFCKSLRGKFGKKDIISGSEKLPLKQVESDSTNPLGINSSSGSFIKSKYEVFYALKSIHMNRISESTSILELENEIEILQRLDHPHIVRLIETFEHKRQVFMLLELCSGGDLYTRDPYTEDQAARIVHSILSAISYMHSKNITHRDLKYENIMFVNTSPKAEIKLIDFGLSKKYASEGALMSEGVGTIYTMAPQVFEGEYTAQADIWSIGVLAYMLVSSQMPFFGKKRRHVIKKIMRCEYDFSGRRWKHVSPQAKQFISDLIKVDPDERPSAEEAMQSIWLNRRFAASLRNPEESTLDNIQATLQNFSNYKRLKKLALMVIAHKSTTAEIGILRKVFTKYDKKKNGCITYDEFRHGLEEYGYSDDDICDMFQGADIDNTGTIKYTEFLAATIEAQGEISEERLAEAFDRLDCDDSGYISVANLRNLLGNDVSKSEIKDIIAECDLTNDNRISYEEFLALWDQHQEEERQACLRQLTYQKSNLASQSGDSTSSESLSTNLSVESDQGLLFREDDIGQSVRLAHYQFQEEKKDLETKGSFMKELPIAVA